MRIVFIHEVSWFNKPVFEMHEIPELLSLQGHDVYFIDYDEGRGRTKFRTVTSIETRTRPGSHVTVTTPPRILPGIVGRLLATIIQPFVFWRLVKRVRPDVVVTYSVPTSGWQAVAICNRMNIPVVARIIDIAHVLRETQVSAIVRWSERFVYEHATFVSCHNEFLRAYCVTNGAREETSGVIYPGVDLEQFYPADKNQALMKSLGILPNDRVLMYMGTIYRFSGLIEILRQLSDSFLQNPELKFLIIGSGEHLSKVMHEATVLGVQKQVVSVGNIGYNLLPDYLRLGDVALLPFRPELVAHAALSGKVLKYLAVGVPVVSTDLKGLRSAITEGEGVTYCSGYENLASATVELLQSPERCRQLSEQGLRKVTQMCDWTIQINEFSDILNSVMI